MLTLVIMVPRHFPDVHVGSDSMLKVHLGRLNHAQLGPSAVLGLTPLAVQFIDLDSVVISDYYITPVFPRQVTPVSPRGIPKDRSPNAARVDSILPTTRRALVQWLHNSMDRYPSS